MNNPLSRLVHRFASRLMMDSGVARQHFDRLSGRVRVLAYHGLVPDGLAGRSWVPSHYVTVSQFDRQMSILASLGAGIVQPLSAALDSLRTGQVPRHPIVCLTFDDGMADNARLALPILAARGFAATFFLATGHVNTGILQSNDMIRLLRHAIQAGRVTLPGDGICRELLSQPGFYKSTSSLSYREELHAFWAACRSKVDPDGIEAMAMMTWDDACRLRDAGMEIGAHTVDHVILSRETDAVRRLQVASSIGAIKRELGLERVPFSFPNGQQDDFGAVDLAVLEALQTPYAATTLPGWNDRATPGLTLQRSCIGLHHSDRAFLATLFGLHDHESGEARRKIA